MKLSDLSKGQKARILSYQDLDPTDETLKDLEHFNKMRDLGMIPGAEIEIRHFGLFGKDPIAVFVRGGIIAMRRADASKIEVEEVSS